MFPNDCLRCSRRYQERVLLEQSGHHRCSRLWDAPKVCALPMMRLRKPLSPHSVEGSQLSRADKRLWKRIWWTLFTRDRSVAVALGRPVHINTDDSDVEMVSEDDFIDDEADYVADYQPDPLHVQFFLQYVKLCEIMGLVLSQQYSVASKARRQNAIDLTHSDMALADWLQNCPREVYWERPRHHFWSALLHSNY
jgi:hypothetical protein